MKTNYRRSKVSDTGGFDYGNEMFRARFKAGLSPDHDGGRRGAADGIREAKTQGRRQQRRKENNELRKELNTHD